MNVVSKIKENSLLSLLIILLILLGIVFVVVLCFEDPKRIFNLLGVSEKEQPKYEVLKFLGISMGGILIALQALMSYKRAKAMEDTAKAQADAANAQARATEEQAKANLHTEQGLRQERLKNAIEHLGHDSSSVRLGGAYELFHLAEDTEEFRQTSLDMLCLHIRQTTGEDEYREKHELKPSEEVQSLLTLLFVQGHEVFKNCDINLQGSWLKGADLSKARLQGAILTGAYLQKADLSLAYLQKAFLDKAYLQKADFFLAYLQKAFLLKAQLQKANLSEARLQEARLVGTGLQGANLDEARLQGADFERAQLQGANLYKAQLHETYLKEADLRGSRSGDRHRYLWTSFEDRIRESIGKEADLSEIIFAGGLHRKDMDFLFGDTQSHLRENLKWHVGKSASNEPPENSGAIIGAYTKEEAEQWIAEYKEAMLEVPEDDS